MRSTVCSKGVDEGDYLFLSCLWFVDYSHSEIDMRAMPITKNEKNKSLQISNSSKLLEKESQQKFSLWK